MANLTNSRIKLHPFPFTIVNSVIIFVGVISNSLIIAATLRHGSTLTSKCNKLICILAVADLCTCLFYFEVNILIWLEWIWVKQNLCFWLSAVQLFLMNCGTFLIWSVSMDRLFILKIPLRYDGWQLRPYFFCMVSPAFLFSGLLVFEGWHHSSNDVVVAICYPPTAFHGNAALENLIYNCLLNIAVVVTHVLAYRAGKGVLETLVYIFITSSYLAAEHDNSIGSSNETMTIIRRTRQSIALVACIYVGTMVITVIILSGVMLATVDPWFHIHASLYVGWLGTLNISCNGIIYGVRSSQYRNQYKTIFCKNQVQPLPAGIASAHP